MKALFLSVFLSAALGSNVFASEKLCTGFDNSIDSRGLVLGVSISLEKIEIKALKGGSYAGTYTTAGKATLSGKSAVSYEGEDDGYFNVIHVEQSLLEQNTSGVIKIRSLGEGYLDAFFNCEDAGMTGF